MSRLIQFIMSVSVSLALSIALCSAQASDIQIKTIHFDQGQAGALPQDWIAGATGRGSPHWELVEDQTAPSKPLALKQSGAGAFPWCIYRGARFGDGFVEVKFKPLSGKVDQAAGLIWRGKDANNYYVARANALENNVSLYYVKNGRRKTIQYRDVPDDLPVKNNVWQSLRVDFKGAHIIVRFQGHKMIELDDAHISGPGAVGVWTKADSVTEFDDFSFGSSETGSQQNGKS